MRRLRVSRPSPVSARLESAGRLRFQSCRRYRDTGSNPLLDPYMASLRNDLGNVHHDFLIRSRINATQPPSSPPPTTVVSSSNNFSPQTDPCVCIASRIPPCNKITASAMVEPTTNHHRKTFMEGHTNDPQNSIRR